MNGSITVALTVEKYARTLLSSITQRDEAVNAWAYLDPESVIEQARRLDKVPFDRRGPLHEVDVAVKDIIYMKDMPTQALLLGKTATAKFAATNKSSKTRNPHGPNRTPGGSSSGSGAAPTWNSISREGVKIYSLLFDTVGIYTRSIEDLKLLADALGVRNDEPAQGPFGVRGTRKFGFQSHALHTPVVNVPGFKGEHVSKAVGEIFEAEGGWKRGL
ncbi:hypothetical protein NKR23_g6723 [Pleurostoma richardsiae]|uniref:Amidase domain-containing protein n=1 Tax=Pleurostoma richardsiae TaxID=41990 RepID=A0AA38R9T7_9PEZI|nr:hypothetical protein NKR23_g6723 [Pleurostoma richardsiae]